MAEGSEIGEGRAGDDDGDDGDGMVKMSRRERWELRAL